MRYLYSNVKYVNFRFYLDKINIYHCLILVILSSHLTTGYYESKAGFVNQKSTYININNVHELFNIKKLLNEFNSPRLNKIPGVIELLARFNETCQRAANARKLGGQRNPFVVIESVYNAGRRTVTELVAHALGGAYCNNPPRIMQGLGTAFDGVLLRRKYYALSKYASANLVKEALPTQAVAMEKYYYDQACFTIAKNFMNKDDIPPKGDHIYSWPPDLLRPDMVFFLNFLKDPTTDEFTHRMIEIYKRMEPRIIEIDAADSVHGMANKIIREINRRTGDNYTVIPEFLQFT
uniref:Uncharacterized protein n=1 Tax=Clastoptera arizonana TaxID=38151 RepID=A0A1B6DJD4_9HEMI